MKKCPWYIAILLLLVACGKKDTSPPEPEAPVSQKGRIAVQVQFYDSLGRLTAAQAGLRLRLDASNSVTLDTNGQAVFDNMAYGDYFVSIVKDFWEAAPLKISHNSAVTTATLPFAAIAPWQAKNFTALAVRKDSIIVNFKLDRPVPAGKRVNIALIAGKENDLSGNNYSSVDIFSVDAEDNKQLEINNFPNFAAFETALDSGKNYFIKVLPVSYGSYFSNVLYKNVLLGDNLFPPDNWLIKKEWKN